MTEGANFEALDCYILVERSGQKIERIYFSSEPPSERSVLAEQIIAYVEGRGPCPEVELDLSNFTEFQRKVIAAVQSISRGQTLTYGEVALLAGCPGAARAVGQVMARNPFAIIMPCHRVVSRQGLGGFGWGLDIKKKLLELERC
ncbi:MAG: MGMT family protein [Methanotrichaceae archaeon]|nr:MGMT family protein [Methanotrichaceae archaeon]